MHEKHAFSCIHNRYHDALRRDGLQKTFAVFGGFFYVQNTNNILNFFYPVLINNLIAWYFVATVITIHFDH